MDMYRQRTVLRLGAYFLFRRLGGVCCGCRRVVIDRRIVCWLGNDRGNGQCGLTPIPIGEVIAVTAEVMPNALLAHIFLVRLSKAYCKQLCCPASGGKSVCCGRLLDHHKQKLLPFICDDPAPAGVRATSIVQAGHSPRVVALDHTPYRAGRPPRLLRDLGRRHPLTGFKHNANVHLFQRLGRVP